MSTCTNEDCGSFTTFASETTRTLEQDERAKAGLCVSCWKRRTWSPHYTPEEREAFRKKRAARKAEHNKAKALREAETLATIRNGTYVGNAEWTCERCGKGSHSHLSHERNTEANRREIIIRAQMGFCARCWEQYQRFMAGKAIQALPEPEPPWHCIECNAANEPGSNFCTACGGRTFRPY